MAQQLKQAVYKPGLLRMSARHDGTENPRLTAVIEQLFHTGATAPLTECLRKSGGTAPTLEIHPPLLISPSFLSEERLLRTSSQR